MGIMAYLGSPLWFLFLLLGTWVAWDRYSSGLSLLPFETYVDRWFHINGIEQSLILTAVVFALLFLPKILAVTGAILSPTTRRSFGGMFPILAGSMLETIVSMLLAPCIMAAHTLMVISIFLGRAVGWGNQNRETDGTSWGDAIRFHAFPTILGIAWTALALKISHTFAAWMSPILLGLVLSAPVSVWTSRSRYGKALAKRKILATPEELNPPPSSASPMRRKPRSIPRSTPPPKAAADSSPPSSIPTSTASTFRCWNTPNSPMPRKPSPSAACCPDPADLSKNELSELLYLAPAMLMMHRAVWLRSAEGIHSVWTQAVESYRRRLDQPPPPNPPNPNHPMLQINPNLTDLVSDAATGLLNRLHSKATITAAAPGRVNLIGEHIDYCDGFVMPFAIDRYVVIAGCANGTSQARIGTSLEQRNRRHRTLQTPGNRRTQMGELPPRRDPRLPDPRPPHPRLRCLHPLVRPRRRGPFLVRRARMRHRHLPRRPVGHPP